MTPQSRVVICSNQIGALYHLSTAVADDRSLKVVGRAASLDLGAALCARKNPDLLLLDLALLDRFGVKTCRKIRSQRESIQIVVATPFATPGDLLRDPKAMNQIFFAGATGFALQNTPDQPLAGALRAPHIDPGLASRALARLIKNLDRPYATPTHLTDNQVHFLTRLAAGATDPQLAAGQQMNQAEVGHFIDILLEEMNLPIPVRQI